MKCPICGEQDLAYGSQSMEYSYKGESIIIADVQGEYCPACGEGVLDMDESKRVNEIILTFNKQVNAAAVDPKFISRVRKKLNLDQKKAAEIFGGGVNAFSRYETGKTRPPLSLVHLLDILDSHPELLTTCILRVSPGEGRPPEKEI
jgi:HTH-type transcriptional regulator/antitoxin MqsA